MGKKKSVVVGEQTVDEKKTKPTSAPSEKKSKPKTVKLVKKSKTRGKSYLKAKKSLKNKTYTLKEAISILKKISFEKFDPSVELHLNTTEKGLKGEVTLPHGTGKTQKIVIFNEEVESMIKEGKLDFDILLATAKDMPKLVKHAKSLGPKGLMPSPKKGTLTDNPQEALKKFSHGALNYKTESKFPLMHQVVGKLSFSEKQLIENIQAFASAVGKKNLLQVYIKTTMSPAVCLEVDSL
jgi:large subunit ribosomal protein L1